jgi:hypothetical protein
MLTGQVQKGRQQIARFCLTGVYELRHEKGLNLWPAFARLSLEVDVRQRAISRAQVDADEVARH